MTLSNENLQLLSFEDITSEKDSFGKIKNSFSQKDAEAKTFRFVVQLENKKFAKGFVKCQVKEDGLVVDCYDNDNSVSVLNKHLEFELDFLISNDDDLEEYFNFLDGVVILIEKYL